MMVRDFEEGKELGPVQGSLSSLRLGLVTSIVSWILVAALVLRRA